MTTTTTFSNMMKIKMTPQVIPHVKMLPECKNVTKQNCVTLWETDDDGKQVGQSQDDWNVDIVLSVRATHATDTTRGTKMQPITKGTPSSP